MGLYLFGLSVGLSTAGINIALGILLLALLVQPGSFFRFARQSPPFWIALFLSLYILARGYWAAFQYPEVAGLLQDRTGDLLMIAGIPALILAWHLDQTDRRLYGLMACYILGLLGAFFYYCTWTELWSYLSGEKGTRLHFAGHTNAIGALFATGFLAVSVLAPEGVWRLWGRPSKRGMLGLGGVLLAVGILLLLVVFWNQSRAVWVALALALLVLAILGMGRIQGTVPDPRRRVALLIALLLLPTLGLLQSQEMVSRRVHQLSVNIQEVWSGEMGSQTSEAVRIRAHLLVAGWAGMREHPIWGWGPGNLKSAVEQTGYPHLKEWPHFHNLYVQLGVGPGGVGLLGFAVLLGWAIWDFCQAFREGQIEPPLLAFVTASWVFFLVLSLGQVRHDAPEGKAWLILLLGLLLLGAARRPSRDPST